MDDHDTPATIKTECVYKWKVSEKTWNDCENIVRGLSSRSRGLIQPVLSTFIYQTSLPLCNIIVLMTSVVERKKRKRTRKGEYATSECRKSVTDCQTKYIGFAILTLDESIHQIHLHFMGTEKGMNYGKQMLFRIIEMAKEFQFSNPIKYITLCSLAYTINFYRKYGFRHFYPPLQKKEDELEITPLAESMSHIKFSDNNKALHDEDMKILLRKIIEVNPMFEKQKSIDFDETVRDGVYMALPI